MALFRVNQARKDLNNWLAQDPGRGSNNYSAALQNALNNAANRQTPAQRYNTGNDQNIQASRENYRLMAQRAADAAAAGTQDLSGGYDASYANSAAEQGRQILMEGQHDNEQALRQLALQGLAAESSQADVLTQALLGAQQLEMNANQMAQARYQAQRDFLTGEVQQAQAEKDNFLGNVWNGLQWLAQTALRTYDNYKGYSQWQQEYDLAVRQYEDELARQTMLDARDEERYRDEQALIKEQWDAELADQEWNRSITERKLALDELAYQDDHAYRQAQIANMGRSSGGSSSSGGAGHDYSMSDLQKAISGYQEAKMLGDEAAMQMWAGEAARMGYPQYLQGLGSGSAAPAASTLAIDLGGGIDAAMYEARRQGLTGPGAYSYLSDMGYSDSEIEDAMYRLQFLWG